MEDLRIPIFGSSSHVEHPPGNYVSSISLHGCNDAMLHHVKSPGRTTNMIHGTFKTLIKQ